MITIDSYEEYDEWVEQLARNQLNRDPSPPKFVANAVIKDIEVVDDDEVTLLTNGSPWSTARVTPTDVLRYTIHDAVEHEVQKNYRRVAVELLAKDIEKKIIELGDAE